MSHLPPRGTDDPSQRLTASTSGQHVYAPNLGRWRLSPTAQFTAPTREHPPQPELPPAPVAPRRNVTARCPERPVTRWTHPDRSPDGSSCRARDLGTAPRTGKTGVSETTVARRQGGTSEADGTSAVHGIARTGRICEHRRPHPPRGVRQDDRVSGCKLIPGSSPVTEGSAPGSSKSPYDWRPPPSGTCRHAAFRAGSHASGA
jgi:hypothetical protein